MAMSHTIEALLLDTNVIQRRGENKNLTNAECPLPGPTGQLSPVHLVPFDSLPDASAAGLRHPPTAGPPESETPVAVPASQIPCFRRRPSQFHNPPRTRHIHPSPPKSNVAISSHLIARKPKRRPKPESEKARSTLSTSTTTTAAPPASSPPPPPAASPLLRRRCLPQLPSLAHLASSPPPLSPPLPR